jgi:hypothetical protein
LLKSYLEDDLFKDGKLEEYEEDKALLAAEVISVLEELEEKLQKRIDEKSPRGRIQAELKKVSKAAEEAYADYVAGKITKPVFQAQLKPYAEMIARILEFDADLRGSGDVSYSERLSDYLANAPRAGDDGNRSKAYVDYRNQLDAVAKRTHERLQALRGVKEEKKEERPAAEGTQVTRQLTEVHEQRIKTTDELMESNQRLLRIADLWIRYGGKDAVVFVADGIGEPGCPPVSDSQSGSGAGGAR